MPDALMMYLVGVFGIATVLFLYREPSRFSGRAVLVTAAAWPPILAGLLLFQTADLLVPRTRT